MKKRKVTVSIPHSVGICPECAKNNTYEKGEELITYCDHSKTGGLYFKGVWMLYTPVTREVFAALIIPPSEKGRPVVGNC